MAFEEFGDRGVLNGSTPVTIVPAPTGTGTSRSAVRYMGVYNKDTATVTLTVRVASGSSSYIIWSGTLNAGSTFIFGEAGEVLVLNEGEYVEALLSSAPTTNNPDFNTSWAEITT
jgi:hypothetical protein